MRRLLTVITSIALTFALSFSVAFASDDALIKSQNYLKTITLDSPDAVIAYEAAGFEADGKADALLNNFKDVDYTAASYGDLAKSIIAISLLGENPKDFNKTNLVEILENRVQEDGTFNALNYNTFKLEPNAYASVEGARALGVINNGSFVLKARKDYTKTTTPVVTEPETPTTPTKPSTTTPAVKPETTTTEPKKETVKVVNTGDNTNVMAYVVAAIAAVGVIVLVIKSKKK